MFFSMGLHTFPFLHLHTGVERPESYGHPCREEGRFTYRPGMPAYQSIPFDY
ncbi:hypothetical protein JF544_03465 [Halobacillus kuroshimensis]|uniref:Uncharacterized protein n=1 Tax=Halobacillus kuroshimensis TaxID=302481 RepID=A0ABS3DSH0_9BACI|nr:MULTISPECIES: hypothetical protein [Halobacillus]MBN8234287.1 hypothetical protein [Halobacillus kuroshimensis]